MNTEEELLADALLEIISWVKSNPDDDTTKPLLVSELVAYGRAYLTFLYMMAISLCVISSLCGIKSFATGLSYDWRQLTKWVPQLTLSVMGLIVSLSLIVSRADDLMQVWFAPRMHVIDKLTEIVIYKS